MPTQDIVPQRDLTVFLLKESVADAAAALRKRASLRVISIPSATGGSSLGELFVKAPRSRLPRWASFFETRIDIAQLGRVSSTSAIFLVKTAGRLFAVAFGQGRHLLVPDCWEERFGLRVAINSIDPSKLRSLDKRTFDALSTQSRVQGTREGPATDFGLDVEQDLVRAVTGTPHDEKLGKSLSGMDSLHCTVRVTPDDLRPLFRKQLEKYESQLYKKHFPWIDHIGEVSDKSLITTLDEELVDVINGTRGRCWLCTRDH